SSGGSMTPAVAADFAAAFGTFIRRTTGLDRPVLCLGRDSRPSGEMLALAATAGLASVGCDVVRLGIVTTPSVAVMIDRHRAAGGMVVTASHNPIQWNGLKCLDRDGVAPPPDDANEIIRRFRERDADPAPPDRPGLITHDDSTHDVHLARVLELVDVDAIRASAFRVVLDSVNGAGCVAGRRLLEALGCDLVHLNGEPTGRFAHTPEPVEENLRDLAARTREAGAVVGFAQDPDADRLAVIDEQGTYIGEEYTIVLAARRRLQVTGPGPMAVNLSTSRMIDDVAAAAGAPPVLRTAVGEANVVAAMKASGAIIGGEGNGGVIVPPVCWVRDSLSAMALMLDLLASERRSLGAIVADLPRYRMIKHKFDLSDVGGREAVPPMLRAVEARFADARLSTADGVRIDVADGWVHLRPSNTEPIVRLIAEAPTSARAWELIDEVAVAAGLDAATRPHSG
ncbi:MAG: phosphoglucosamine mutase, partial [Phycisphaerales bacterium]|nr:phosphoglucosamine mutase [Phycisphaerales bacterium]